jgi:hypothetical protein
MMCVTTVFIVGVSLAGAAPAQPAPKGKAPPPEPWLEARVINMPGLPMGPSFGSATAAFLRLARAAIAS